MGDYTIYVDNQMVEPIDGDGSFFHGIGTDAATTEVLERFRYALRGVKYPSHFYLFETNRIIAKCIKDGLITSRTEFVSMESPHPVIYLAGAVQPIIFEVVFNGIDVE